MCKIIGIDISKQTFDVCFQVKNKWKHKVFENKREGFRKLIRLLNEADWLVMEASGSYYLSLATFLFSEGYKVSVVNPLVIKRYSQTKLSRAKTDKKDAQIIAEYGKQYDMELWEPDSQAAIHLRQIHTSIELLNKQIRQTSNQLEAFNSSGFINKTLKLELNKSLKYFEKQKQKLEKQMHDIAIKQYREGIIRLMTIPGIGIKTAIMLNVITDGFKKFKNYKQLIAYVGFSPRIHQSGTSINGKASICKMGKSQIRKLLYMCSWSAKKSNKGCIAMYDRLSKKGKPERVIKIALANKLLKQAFAIGKKEVNFDLNFI